MAVVLIPIDSFHSHEIKHNDCQDNFELEIDQCHVSIYHSESEKNQCEHKEHIVDNPDECEICKYITSRRFEITLDKNSSFIQTSVFQTEFYHTYSFHTTYLIDNSQSRAPPLV